MKLMTFGSKMLDDAIKFHDEIKNILRITNISPFCFSINRNKDSKYFIKNKDKYADNIVDFELGHTISCDEADYIFLDFLDARMHFEEIELHNGEKIRLTVSNFSIPHRKEILDNVREPVSIKEINPIQFNINELEKEIKDFAQALKKEYPNKKIIILENQHILYYISSNNQLVLVPNYQELYRQNQFFAECYRIAHKYFTAVFLPFPEGMITKDYKNIWSYPRSYYNYVVQNLSAIFQGRIEYKKQLQKYKKEMYWEIKQLWLDQTRQAIIKAHKGRTVLMPKSEIIVPEQLMANGVPTIISLDEEVFTQILSDENRELNNYLDRTQFFWFIPFDKIDKNLLDLLWTYGFAPRLDYLCPVLETIKLNDFSGIYKDCFDNIVETKDPIDVCISGVKNKVTLCTLLNKSKLSINMCCANTINIGENNRTLGNGPKGFQIICGYNSTVSIGKDGTLGVDLIIDSGDHCDILIGDGCLFSTEVLIKNTISEQLVWLRQTQYFTRSSINIGNHVWLGLRVNVFSGANVGNNSMIGARSLLKNTFPSNSQIVGIYPKDRVIRQGITWSSDLNGKKLRR